MTKKRPARARKPGAANTHRSAQDHAKRTGPTISGALRRGIAEVEDTVGLILGFTLGLSDDADLEISIADADSVRETSRLLQKEVRRHARRARVLLRDTKQGTLAQLELSAGTSRDRQHAVRAFSAKLAWGSKLIDQYQTASLDQVRMSARWALTFSKGFPDSYSLYAPIGTIEEVWRHAQFHRMGAVYVPIVKQKLRLSFGMMAGFQFILVHPPRYPGFEPRPKVLFPSRRQTVGDRTIWAFDTAGVEKGNEMLPAIPPFPKTRFFGYMKVIYVTGVAAGCRIQFRQVRKSKLYVLPPGANAWRTVDAGRPLADPPVGEQSHNDVDLGDGKWMKSDFPSGAWPPNAPVCSYAVYINHYRTWIIEICGNTKTFLGYWDWGFTQNLHQGNAGTESIATPPPPANVPRPPGGWPNAPKADGATWTARENAPQAAQDEYQQAYGESVQ